jgi:hypothetical protein
MKANTNQFGSFFAIRKKDQKTLADAKCKNKMSNIQHHDKEEPEFLSKLRSALFQGGEDDESITHQVNPINTTENYCKVTNKYPIPFGSLSFDTKKIKIKGIILDNRVTVMPNTLVFKGSSLHKQQMKLKRFILIGAMRVDSRLRIEAISVSRSANNAISVIFLYIPARVFYYFLYVSLGRLLI